MGMLQPRPVAWLAELVSPGCTSSGSLTNVGSVILAPFIPLLLERVFV
jgi:hypothetical protein